MSWSGPVAGAAPYQPPPYSNGQAPYQPPAYQYGQPPPQQQQQQQPYGQYPAGQPFSPQGAPTRPPETRPPKKKGNPIITRYPPPPGYRGPAQPQGPYGTQQYHQYQQPQSPYAQGPPVPPSYPNSGYQGPSPTHAYPPQPYAPPQTGPQQPAYPQPGYPPASAYQWPQQPQPGYPQQSGYSQPLTYPPTPGYPPPQTAYPGYPPQPSPVDPNQQPWAQPQPQGWQQPTPQYPQSLSGSDPNATPTSTSAYPATTQGDSSTTQPQSATSEHSPGEKPPLFLAWDDWDFDFDGAIWPKANEPVDPDFSLGVIIWRPAKQVTRALPANFAQAEEQALKPPAEKLGNGESVSIYFTSENSHEAFLDVRQTDDWYKIRKDPVFVVFNDEDMARNLVPIEECIALRDRPDEPVEEVHDDDDEMHDTSWSVMDGLEQALSGNSESGGTVESNKVKKESQDKAQEDILAKLGVTGAPKPPSNEPMTFPLFDAPPPASLPPKPPVAPPSNIPPRPGQPPSRTHSYSGHRTPSQSQPPPPSPQEYDPWNPRDTLKKPTGQIFDRSRGSPARSEDSNRSVDSEKPAGGADTFTIIPSLKRSDSSSARKRSYEDTDNEDGQGRQQEDYTKRKRRSQVDAAYSRR